MALGTEASPDNEALRQLQEEHRRYSEKVEGLALTPYPSSDLQMEEARLKKQKLRIKDQMVGHRPGYRFN